MSVAKRTRAGCVERRWKATSLSESCGTSSVRQTRGAGCSPWSVPHAVCGFFCVVCVGLSARWSLVSTDDELSCAIRFACSRSC
eukprot:458382-Rhodomonas_salina.2